MPDEKSLTFSFNYFDSLFNNSTENSVLIINDHGIIQSLNKAFTLNFGYAVNDLSGKYFAELFTEEDRQNGLPENELQKVLTKGQASDNNYLVAKDKTITWVSGESVLAKNIDGEASILKVIQNIHQQKVSEVSLKKLNTFNEDILKSIEDAVIVLDQNLDIVKANSAFFILFAYDNTDKQEVNFGTLIKKYDDYDTLQRSMNATLLSGKSFTNIPLEIKIHHDEKRVYDISCSPLERSGADKSILLIIHDITVHKQVEREREDVIGFVAHELRNPLANLVLCNEIMEESIKENNVNEIKDMLQRSKNNVTRLNRMIAELYDATKANSGNFKLDILPFNFSNMLHEAIGTIQILQPSYNIIINGEANIMLRGDRYRLIQVVTNYLSNGIKYSNGKHDVSLTVAYDDTSITVCVKDNGLGISQDHLPYIFQRFFRAEKTKNLEGIGLGLYLCQQIIHAHNGKVWAESEEGLGSSFYFSIPR